MALLRAGVILITSLLLLSSFSTPVATPQVATDEPTPVEGAFAEASNFIRVDLPYPVYSIAVGNTSQGPGFVHVQGSLLKFRNPVTSVDDNMSVGPGTVVHETLTGADMDGDGNTEFLVMKFSILGTYFVMVDLDTHSKTEYSYMIAGPRQILTGDFDGDGGTDFAIYNGVSLFLFDGTDGSTIESFAYGPGTIVRACVGDFTADAGDEIAVLYDLLGSAHIQTVSGVVGSIRDEPILGVTGCDIITYHYGAGIDDIAVTLLNDLAGDLSYLAAYTGNLGSIFSVTNPVSRGPPTLKAGYFNSDGQEDLVVLGKSYGFAWFVNGLDGSTITTSMEECNAMSWRAYSTAILDSDSYTDIATQGPRGQLSLIRGFKGETGYEEPRAPGPFVQVLTYDLNSDGRDDMLALTDQVAILLSDIDPPEVALEPLYPAHPTFYDTYIKLELSATDELEVRSATLFIKPVGGVTTGMYQQQEMVKTPTGKYIFIMAGLQPSQFDYYIKVTDPYLNTFSYGNETNPETLTVQGHFAWGYFYNTTIEQGHTSALAMGNASTGEQRLFAMMVEPSVGTATVLVLSPSGTEVGQTQIVPTSRNVKFEVYSGMFDGDNILDPLVVGYNTTHTGFWILHGNNLTIWKSDIRVIPSVTANYGMAVFDDDQDLTDELHYVGYDGSDYLLMRADAALSSWTNTALPDNSTAVVGAAYAVLYTPGPQLGILRRDNSVNIYQAHNLTLINTLSYSSPGSTPGDNPYAIRAFHNSSRPTDQFVAVYGGWDIDTPVTYVCFIDSETSTVGDAPSYILSGRHATTGTAYDADADSTDEILIVDNVGNVSLLDTSYTQITRWTTFVSEASPLSSALLDYDGDGVDEFLLSTSDDTLTAISLTGVVEYQARVGMLFNMMNVGNVDPGSGEDVAAFPILRASNTIGAIRNIELFYVLDVSFALETGVILQGTNLWANTTVLNVYNEPVTDAFVSLTASYRFGGSIVEQSFGSVYSNSTQEYSSTITPNWPMGMVNLSLAVTHEYYDSYYDSFPNALRVESPLSVSVFVLPEVDQGSNLAVNVSVTDSLSARVTDASVNVTLGGTIYPATYNGEFYHVIVTNITLPLGSHALISSADHPYATEPTSRSASFSVITSTLNIVRNSPPLAEQDQYFIIELTITDRYGSPLSDAEVVIDFGVTEFAMSQMGPGLYMINDTASMPVGNYTCRILVNHDFVMGNLFGSFYMGVVGNLSPVVSYQSTVEAGTYFDISVFVYDHYGTVPEGANVTVVVGGTVYQANFTGGAEFRVTAFADFPIGERAFIVYVGATFAHPRSDVSWVTVISSPYMTLTSSSGWVLTQGQSSLLRLQLRDWSGNPVAGATVVTQKPGSLAFTDHGNGTYTVTFSTAGYGPGAYNLIVSVTHTHLYTAQTAEGLEIRGSAEFKMQVSREFLNYNDQTFNFTVTDQYGNPLSGFSYSARFAGVFFTSGISPTYNLSWTLLPNVPPGLRILNLTITGDHIIRTTREWPIEVLGQGVVTVAAPTPEETYTQGEDQIAFRVHVADSMGHFMPGATVSIIVQETTYQLTPLGNGTYTHLVATTGWAPGNYSYFLLLTHAFLRYSDQISGSVMVTGLLTLDIVLSTEAPEQGTTVMITVRVYDDYSHPMTGATVTVTFAEIPLVIPEASSPGVYETELEVGFIHYGDYELIFHAEHLLCNDTSSTRLLQVTVRPPDLSMSAETFVLGSGVSFLISFIGLLIYFKISSSLAVADVTSQGAARSIRRMDRLYVGIVGLGMLTLFHSFISAQAGNFGLAVAESVLVLGISVLLYGIWLYRDANYALIRAKSISRKRMILGLWHLVFVPLVIVQMFSWGSEIQWFSFFILESTFDLGPIPIPTILLTIFATYISSIVIVVVNMYREIRNSLLRLDRMAAAGTPPAVVAEERLHLVGRLGSSIRMKFFMFLVILAAPIVVSLNFLQSYSLGVIILMPVVFLVVIPFLASKMLRGASRVSGRMRERRPSRSLTAVADETTVVSDRPREESYTIPDKSVPIDDTEWKTDKDSDADK